MLSEEEGGLSYVIRDRHESTWQLFEKGVDLFAQAALIFLSLDHWGLKEFTILHFLNGYFAMWMFPPQAKHQRRARAHPLRPGRANSFHQPIEK